jgi:hypothetical protein
MELKNVTFHYTVLPVPSCDSRSCQDTIKSTTTLSHGSGGEQY